MISTRATIRKMRLLTGLLLVELLIISMRPMPVSSMRSPLTAGDQSSVSDQMINYLPVLFNSWEIPATKIYCMGDSLTDAGIYEIVLIARLGSRWEIFNMGSSG